MSDGWIERNEHRQRERMRLCGLFECVKERGVFLNGHLGRWSKHLKEREGERERDGDKDMRSRKRRRERESGKHLCR